MKPIVSVRDHERDAMWQLVHNARAFAGMVSGEHSVKLKVWAQAVEDVLNRMEQHDDAKDAPDRT